jgi:hypothetical protein
MRKLSKKCPSHRHYRPLYDAIPGRLDAGLQAFVQRRAYRDCLVGPRQSICLTTYLHQLTRFWLFYRDGIRIC